MLLIHLDICNLKSFYFKLILFSAILSSSGSYCNHYFLQALAQIGRGYYDTAFGAGEFYF